MCPNSSSLDVDAQAAEEKEVESLAGSIDRWTGKGQPASQSSVAPFLARTCASCPDFDHALSYIYITRRSDRFYQPRCEDASATKGLAATLLFCPRLRLSMFVRFKQLKLSSFTCRSTSTKTRTDLRERGGGGISQRSPTRGGAGWKSGMFFRHLDRSRVFVSVSSLVSFHFPRSVCSLSLVTTTSPPPRTYPLSRSVPHFSYVV